jgi:hypothetical protein
VCTDLTAQAAQRSRAGSWVAKGRVSWSSASREHPRSGLRPCGAAARGSRLEMLSRQDALVLPLLSLAGRLCRSVAAPRSQVGYPALPAYRTRYWICRMCVYTRIRLWRVGVGGIAGWGLGIACHGDPKIRSTRPRGGRICILILRSSILNTYEEICRSSDRTESLVTCSHTHSRTHKN